MRRPNAGTPAEEEMRQIQKVRHSPGRTRGCSGMRDFRDTTPDALRDPTTFSFRPPAEDLEGAALGT